MVANTRECDYDGGDCCTAPTVNYCDECKCLHLHIAYVAMDLD